jgi:hypothetical protein
MIDPINGEIRIAPIITAGLFSTRPSVAISAEKIISKPIAQAVNRRARENLSVYLWFGARLKAQPPLKTMLIHAENSDRFCHCRVFSMYCAIGRQTHRPETNAVGRPG